MCLGLPRGLRYSARMEPQFMILGHAAGVVAALSSGALAKGSSQTAVQDVDTAALHALLVADGALLTLPPPAPPQRSRSALAPL